MRDGSAVQQNIVRENGVRAVLLTRDQERQRLDARRGERRRRRLWQPARAAPPGLNINELFDQSVFVKASVDGVVREGAIAAALTALMILLFLGSWRSTLIVVMISIPLAILTSLVALYFLGDTLNTMTLGGLALAVGILVDDSTVTIENTHRLLTEERMPLPQATLHGSAGIAVPTLVSTLAICCVFTSVVFLEGPAKYLFTPLGLAVVFAMLASYALSRTLTPITIGLLLKGEQHGDSPKARGELVRPLPRRLRARLRAHAPGLCRALEAPARRERSSFRSPPLPCSRSGQRCICWSAATSIRSSTAARSSCMSARLPERASRRPRESSQADRGQDPRGHPRRGPRS